jgi:NAD(P)H dehydrogenase (quinone)
MIVVTGATGRLGQLVIDGLLERVFPAQIIGSAGAGRVASATRADYAAAAVAVLTGDGHENTVYELDGDVAWSYAELAEVLSKAAGQESLTACF